MRTHGECARGATVDRWEQIAGPAAQEKDKP
jgi:hypothetical protein